LTTRRIQTVSIVIPVYNEEEAVMVFHSALCAAIDRLAYRFTILYVNDGSRDGTAAALERIRAADGRVRVVELSRNFGHQSALTAGLDRAEGDFVVSMDGDGQHPPELIAEMLEMARAGCDVVLTQRLDDESISAFKRRSAELFYGLINRLGETQILRGGADFRLMSRSAADALREMREYHRFLRGMVAWMGFRTAVLPYRPSQRLAGKTKYTLRKMLRLGRDAVFSFSLLPLYLGLSLGLLFLCLSLAEVAYVLSFWVSGRTQNLAPGWSSLMFVLLVVGGILMVLLGFIGVYLGFIFQEVKRRPIYLVREEKPTQPGPAALRSGEDETDEVGRE
jgi:polyisoprenyl-phosphate glycosyltransferase